jgi:hypothetical protein
VLANLGSDTGNYFSNTLYGASVSETFPQFRKQWLAIIGEIMSWVIIILQVVFIGNDLLYKADNVIILVQTIYFFSFVQLLVGQLLSQFYYGWIYAHGGFFPNFFSVPPEYMELEAPNSYKLATLDANVVRNAGFSMSLLLVFIGCYAVVTLAVWLIYTVFNKTEVWHPKIAVNSLIGGLEFFSMSIFYWSVANLMYIKGADSTDSGFYSTSKSVSIFFIVIICLYTVGRWVFNPLGGLYMAKRILLAAMLPPAYQNNAYLAPVIILETVFTIARYFMEAPDKLR